MNNTTPSDELSRVCVWLGSPAATASGRRPVTQLTASSVLISVVEMEKTRCQLEREHILGAAGLTHPQRPGLFVPECDEHGHYVPTQCHGSTGQCWCVDRDGRELEGTRTRPGMRPPCKSEGSATLGLGLRRASGTRVPLPVSIPGGLAQDTGGTFCLS